MNRYTSRLPKDLIKVYRTEYVRQFTVPAGRLVTGIYGLFRKNVLRIRSKVGEDREKFLGRVQAPPPYDQKSTNGEKEGGNYCEKLPARVPAPPSSYRKRRRNQTSNLRGKR
ncbi:uncharacterized protein LOC111445142 [Cucurbita moschata]|uniref:Uncharacterized protein LOC111445142 n=1 Tax=Cucurbita moschata TaxID=3662 RepID=A0A6J1FF38_CUCMO|nr:uncharacterized protein LOC111445142 [Cucurbita moschata]